MNIPANRPEYLWDIESIFAFFDQYERMAGEPINTDDGQAVANRLAEFIPMLSASTNVCAAAKWYADAVYKEQFDLIAANIKKAKAEGLPIDGMASPSVVRDYIRSRCAEFNALQERAGRINAAITHTLDALRSLLSKIKTDKIYNH